MVIMERFLNTLLSFFFALSLFPGCGNTPKNEEKAQEISIVTNEDSHSLYLQEEARDFFVRIIASDDWELTTQGADNEALTTTPLNGCAGENAIAVSVKSNQGGLREFSLVAKLMGTSVADTLKIVQEGKNNDKERILGDTTLLEMPRLSGDPNDFYITHKVENGTRVNYSLEWNSKKYHSRWVCFSFDSYTSQVNAGRSNAWSWDPLIPTKYEVYRSDFESSTYARGHMVASHDRVYSEEANKQTFYYTNMSPQLHEHNSGVWVQLEQIVQGWARSMDKEEKLYVAKGGTIRDDQIESYKSNNKLVIPKYYWMAILRQNGSEWHAIAFLTETAHPKKVKGGVATLALSVDELEDFVGLDFFYHLPDEFEQVVEAEQPTENKTLWPGL